uniref:Uncharacterized protein n=1 Tax=Anguilla anguilla TaxID=7936 RepID=A0A0E9WCN9_ANGAN
MEFIFIQSVLKSEIYLGHPFTRFDCTFKMNKSSQTSTFPGNPVTG